MGNKTSKKTIEQKLIVSKTSEQKLVVAKIDKPIKTDIEILKSLYEQKNYNKFMKYIPKEKISLKLISKILKDCSDEELSIFIKNMNRFTIIRIFYTFSEIKDSRRIEFILQSDPQKFLQPTIKLLPKKCLEFLMKYEVKIHVSDFLFLIRKGRKDKFSILLNKGFLLIKEENLKYLLGQAIIEEQRDIFLSMIGKIGLKNIDFDYLYKCVIRDEMKIFLDELLKQRISLIE